MPDHDQSSPVGSNDADARTEGPPEGARGIVVDRSEERLIVSTVARPVERVRLEKYLVTEEQTITVTVRREEVRLVRGLDPRAASDDGGAPLPRVGEVEDVSLTLHEERIVVTREVVPVERVHLRASVVTENQPVEATLRKERVEVSQPALPGETRV